MPDQVDMPPAIRHHMETKMKGEKIGEFTVRDVLGSGNTAITYEVEDKGGVRWALKLVSRESYGDRAPFREVGRFATVEDERFLVFPKEIGDWELKLNQTIEFIWFKSRCVKGQTLRKFLASGRHFNAKAEVQNCIEHLAVGLEELGRMGFGHGDMHDGNVMREVIGEKGEMPEVRYVIIDFSESCPTSDTQGGLHKDLECFGQHIKAIADAIYRRKILSRDDEKILQAIQHIPGLLHGVTSESIGVTRPSDVFKRFHESMRLTEEAPRRLQTPFDALSAEDIKNDALLTDLCFTKNWWVAELEKPGNVLLVGPRGCGKSMLFRRLRLKTKIAARKEQELKNDRFVGFHLPCESLFFNRIADLSDAVVEANRDLLLLFFNMAVTMEVATTLAVLPKLLGPLTLRAVDSLRLVVQEEAGALWNLLNLSGAGASVYDIAECAELIMRHIRRSIAEGDRLHVHGTLDYVSHLVGTIKREIPALSGRLFIFFLDDYTEERVPLALQRSLHPVVCQRSGDLCFKILAHMFGSIYSFPQPLALDEGRNIKIINLGSEYLNRNRKKAEGRALIQIMNERFKKCDGYQGAIKSWLGRTSFAGGKNLNRALHDKDTRASVKYHGIECLVELCTGDISEMIRMVGEIFREAGIGAGVRPHAIPPATQDKAIRNISRDFLSRIRNIRPDGQKLYDVVDAFGKLSQQYLYERDLVGQGKDSKGNQRKDPYDLLTIYVDDLTKAAPAARRTWERLQRASIFVDIRLAPSQRTVIADRVTLRRIYSPAFGTTLTSSEHLQLTKEQFEWFMDTPAEFCKKQLQKSIKDSAELSLWIGEAAAEIEVGEEQSLLRELPEKQNERDFSVGTPEQFRVAIEGLPSLQEIQTLVNSSSHYDVFIGAMGFEERTSAGVAALVHNGAHADKAMLLEFDSYFKATEKQRSNYEKTITELTGGAVHRPISAPTSTLDLILPERLRDALLATRGKEEQRVIFDCTSCPSRILSKCLRVLLSQNCDLTLVYSEAKSYYPTREEWESGKLKPRGFRVEGPFSGVRFVEKPPILQADDMGERPLLLVLLPAFNTERTSNVLAELDPAKRIWLIGEPHDLSADAYRIEMAKAFAAPAIYPGDLWSLMNTFDYRKTLLTLASIYAENRFNYRIVVMPHGSKMQTFGVNLFAIAHQISMAFAMPKEYNPDRYSTGCKQVWGLPLGNTKRLVEKMDSARVVGNLAK